MATIDDTTEKL